MIIHTPDYPGTPPEMVASLEKIAQATLQQMFELAQKVYGDRSIELWNCSVYRSTVVHDDVRYKRLRIKNHSCGYWVVIEFGQPSFCHLEQYKNAWDFLVFATQTANKEVNERSVNWETFLGEWGYGRADLFWQARKLSQTDTWYAPTHTLDFKHPLLTLLRHGVEPPP